MRKGRKRKKVEKNNTSQLYSNYLVKRGWEPMYDPDGTIFGWRHKDSNPLNIVSVQKAIKFEMNKELKKQNKTKCQVIKLMNFSRF